ncbi:MAG: RNA polymerase sigma factor [Planctomycetes bacterium]|nr:RNA polymerase sigma factor [Planctomycetota bacterium]
MQPLNMTIEAQEESGPPGGGVDPAFFEGVIDRYETPLLRYVGRLIGYANPEKEDIIQETFIRYHKNLLESQEHPPREPKSWLYRVAHNLAMDEGRKVQRHRKHHEVIQTETKEEEQIEKDMLEGIIQRETGRQALDELKQLHEEEQQVILLKTIQDLKLREIAEVTGLTVNKVSYRLNQGLKHLASRLREGGHFG